MLIGNLIALRQRSIKRMLAYSSIAHAGYISVAFLSPGTAGGSAIIYYLVAYMLMSMGAFAIILAFDSSENASDDLTSFNGFSQKNPMLAALMALFMLSMAGIPPGLAGLLGKFYILNSAVQAGYVGLTIVAVLSAAIGCYYYLRVIVAMYFIDADSTTPTLNISGTLLAVLLFCGMGVILLGIFPSLLYESSVWILKGIILSS
jgi:NADH-quinone oxidoreductase subunit N